MHRETNTFTVTLVDGKYYSVDVKEDVEFEEADLHELVKCQRELSNEILPVLVICSSNANASSDFVRYLAKNENNPLCLADAFVLKSIAQHLLAHFYKLFITPERPTAFFKTKEDAIKWLEQFFRS
jgi:hypothetical protein